MKGYQIDFTKNQILQYVEDEQETNSTSRKENILESSNNDEFDISDSEMAEMLGKGLRRKLKTNFRNVETTVHSQIVNQTVLTRYSSNQKTRGRSTTNDVYKLEDFFLRETVSEFDDKFHRGSKIQFRREYKNRNRRKYIH